MTTVVSVATRQPLSPRPCRGPRQGRPSAGNVRLLRGRSARPARARAGTTNTKRAPRRASPSSSPPRPAHAPAPAPRCRSRARCCSRSPLPRTLPLPAAAHAAAPAHAPAPAHAAPRSHSPLPAASVSCSISVSVLGSWVSVSFSFSVLGSWASGLGHTVSVLESRGVESAPLGGSLLWVCLARPGQSRSGPSPVSGARPAPTTASMARTVD